MRLGPREWDKNIAIQELSILSVLRGEIARRGY